MPSMLRFKISRGTKWRLTSIIIPRQGNRGVSDRHSGDCKSIGTGIHSCKNVCRPCRVPSGVGAVSFAPSAPSSDVAFVFAQFLDFFAGLVRMDLQRCLPGTRTALQRPAFQSHGRAVAGAFEPHRPVWLRYGPSAPLKTKRRYVTCRRRAARRRPRHQVQLWLCLRLHWQ